MGAGTPPTSVYMTSTRSMFTVHRFQSCVPKTVLKKAGKQGREDIAEYLPSA